MACGSAGPVLLGAGRALLNGEREAVTEIDRRALLHWWPPTQSSLKEGSVAVVSRPLYQLFIR